MNYIILQVYRGRGWSSADDHIHFTIGRQAASLKQVGDAVRAFEKLLKESSKQPSVQQAAFLREFLHTHHVCPRQRCILALSSANLQLYFDF